MLVIAKRTFVNPQRAIELEAAQHPDVVHKGAIFAIGAEKTPFKDLKKAEKELALSLTAADCLSDATDTKVVAAIRAEVTEEEKVAKRQEAKPEKPAK